MKELIQLVKTILKVWFFVTLAAWIYVLSAIATAGGVVRDGLMGFTVVLVFATAIYLWLRDRWRTA